MSSLYELTEEYRRIETLLQESDWDEKTIEDTLESLEYDWAEKARNVARMIKNKEALMIAINEAGKEMAERFKKEEAKVTRLKAYLAMCMRNHQVERMEYPEFCISVKNNPGKLQIENLSLIPDEYMISPPPLPAKPDKRKILEDLKSGKQIPGCLMTKDTRLEIK